MLDVRRELRWMRKQDNYDDLYDDLYHSNDDSGHGYDSDYRGYDSDSDYGGRGYWGHNSSYAGSY